MFGPQMKGFFGRGHRGRGWGFDPRRGRVFEKGDLKYVLLDLLEDKPSHGYELIRALEERFRGFYSPSPGSVYPTLQLLEDLGYVTVTQRDGKKIYTITDEGRKFLAEHRESVEDIWDRAGGGWDLEFARELQEIKYELMRTGKLFGSQMRTGRVDREKLRRIKEVIANATQSVEDILEEREEGGGGTRV